MGADNAGLKDYCDQWGLSDLEKLTETPRANVYTCFTKRRDQAVLKVYKDFYGIEFERNGVSFLKTLDQGLGAHIYHADDGAALMEYLEGPMLSTYVPDHDDQASYLIAQMALRLNRSSKAEYGDRYPDMMRWFKALFEQAKETVHENHAYFEAAAYMAENLINAAPKGSYRMMHGDLHHENIMALHETPDLNSPDDWRVIDPKGVFGLLGYEVANAMRNPHTCTEIITKERILRQSRIFSDVLDIDQNTILKFGNVHAWLSCAWSSDNGNYPKKAFEIAKLFHEIVN